MGGTNHGSVTGYSFKKGGGKKLMYGGMRHLKVGGTRKKRGGKQCFGGGARKSALRSYRRRGKTSKCRKKGPAVCRSLRGCKYASKGKKRSFCRKVKNTRRRR
jgi:hypothetical protein